MNNEIIVIEPEETDEIVVIENDIKILKPNTQEKEVNPEKYRQQVTPDENYTGLSKVIVNAVSSDIDTNIKPENIKKDIEILGVRGEVNPLNGIKTEITSNGIYRPEKPYNGFTEVSVKTSGVDINDYWVINQTTGVPNDSTHTLQPFIKKAPILDFANKTSLSNLFADCINLTEIQGLKNTENVTSFSNMFRNCLNLTEIPDFDTSNGDYFTNMFYGCTNLRKVPNLDFSKGRYLSSLFRNCTSLEEILNLNTSNATTLEYAFYNTKIKKLNKLNCSNVRNISNVLYRNMNLQDFGGFENLGEAYLNTDNSNYSDYGLDLSPCPLTHDSLMNVINGLYDISSKGVKPQQLVLGSTNLSKLTADEIAIATNKGWRVS